MHRKTDDDWKIAGAQELNYYLLLLSERLVIDYWFV
jgi:hypothetical protein